MHHTCTIQCTIHAIAQAFAQAFFELTGTHIYTVTSPLSRIAQSGCSIGGLRSSHSLKKRSKFLRKHPKRRYFTAPMVHVRNDGGTATMKHQNIEPYMRNLLRFKRKQTDTLGILKSPDGYNIKLS